MKIFLHCAIYALLSCKLIGANNFTNNAIHDNVEQATVSQPRESIPTPIVNTQDSVYSTYTTRNSFKYSYPKLYQALRLTAIFAGTSIGIKSALYFGILSSKFILVGAPFVSILGSLALTVGGIGLTIYSQHNLLQGLRDKSISTSAVVTMSILWTLLLLL